MRIFRTLYESSPYTPSTETTYSFSKESNTISAMARLHTVYDAERRDRRHISISEFRVDQIIITGSELNHVQLPD